MHGPRKESGRVPFGGPLKAATMNRTGRASSPTELRWVATTGEEGPGSETASATIGG